MLACAKWNTLTIIIGGSNMAASQVRNFEKVLKKELNTAKLQHLGFASGGCINEGQSYDTDHGKIFVKLNEKSEVLQHLRNNSRSIQGNLLP